MVTCRPFSSSSHALPPLDHLLRAELALHALPSGSADLPCGVGMIEQILGPAGQARRDAPGRRDSRSTSCSIRSRVPGTSVATTGTPAAMASRIAWDWPGSRRVDQNWSTVRQEFVEVAALAEEMDLVGDLDLLAEADQPLAVRPRRRRSARWASSRITFSRSAAQMASLPPRSASNRPAQPIKRTDSGRPSRSRICPRVATGGGARHAPLEMTSIFSAAIPCPMQWSRTAGQVATTALAWRPM